MTLSLGAVARRQLKVVERIVEVIARVSLVRTRRNHSAAIAPDVCADVRVPVEGWI